MTDARPPLWHRRTVRGLSGLQGASISITVALVLVAAAFSQVAPTTPLAGLSLLPLLIAMLGCISAAFHFGRAGASKVLLVALGLLTTGAAIIVGIGAMESLGLASLGGTAHAILGLVGLGAVLAGTIVMGPALGPLVAVVAPHGTRLAAIGRRVRWITYASLALGVVLPFVPLWLSWMTPRSCAIWTAGIGAAIFAIPGAAATVGLGMLLTAILGNPATAAAWCPECGYPRPANTRCPECGTGDDPSKPHAPV